MSIRANLCNNVAEIGRRVKASDLVRLECKSVLEKLQQCVSCEITIYIVPHACWNMSVHRYHIRPIQWYVWLFKHVNDQTDRLTYCQITGWILDQPWALETFCFLFCFRPTRFCSFVIINPSHENTKINNVVVCLSVFLTSHSIYDTRCKSLNHKYIHPPTDFLQLACRT